MNLIFLSPHFPPNFRQFCVHLRRFGVSVLGLADEPWENLDPELRDALAEYFRVGLMEDYDAVYRSVAHLIHRHGRIDRIESHNEYWMDLEARLRQDFNIPGPRPADVEDAKRKSGMKLRFERAGIPVARGMLAESLETATRFAREVGFPLIAKPDVGVGASATFKISSPVDLESFFNKKGDRDYFLEEFIQGAIVTFDGLTDRDGHVVFFASLEYSRGVMEAVNEDTDIYYYTYRTIPEDLKTYGLRIVKEFDVRERFFHIEFFRRQVDGRLVALEANLRPPGGYTIDMFNYADDIDLYFEWANVVANNRFSSSCSRPYHCSYVGRKRHIRYQHTHDEIMERHRETVLFHTAMPPAFRNAMGDYAYIVRAETMDQLMPIVTFIQERAPREQDG